MEIRLDELADLVGGKLHGDATKRCLGTNPPRLANESQVSMVVDGDVSAFDQSYIAAAVITPTFCEDSKTPQIVVANPHEAFAT
ncbi:MAG: hypothetical protein AAGJ83_09130, partial [Planctomycetota bacterium]